MATGDKFPLFTSRHQQHSAAWTVPGFSMQWLCIACATERLENSEELTVHVKKVLQEFQALLSSGAGEQGRAFIKTISSDTRTTEHLSNVLFSQLADDLVMPRIVI